MCPQCHVVLQRELADGRKSCGSAKPLTTVAHHGHPRLHPAGAAAWAVQPQKAVLSAAPAELLGMDPVEPLACAWLSGTGEQLTCSRHSTCGVAAALGMLQIFQVPAEM